jgi:basic amino acid/polyamine antiporter, APA family
MSKLLRVLGVGFGLAVTVGNTVGAGILRAPGEVAAQLPQVGPFLMVWVAGGVYALLGAFALSELGAMMPRSGGYYVFARRALGDFPAFVVGWTDWLAQCGTIATASILVGEYLGDLFPSLAGRQVATAATTALVLALVQARGIRWGALVQGLTSSLKALVLLSLVAAFLLVAPPASEVAAPPGRLAEGGVLAIGVLIALQAVIYTYDGWYGVIYFGEEVRQPARDVPRSMIGGVLLVAGLYLLVNVALLQVLPLPAMAGQTLAVGAAVGRLFGPVGDTVIRAVAIICLVSGINAYQLMASRIPLAMGREGLLPPAFVRVNAGGTPTVGLAFSTLAALFFIASGSFQRVMALMAFFFVANYVAAFVAVFVLRRREPETARPYRAWGYPWTTALALAVSVAFLVGAVAGDTRNSVHSLLVLAAGYPVYRLVRRFGGAWNPR